MLSYVRLLLGRKVMISLDSILVGRDITLPTNVHIVRAMVFPVVVYGCQSWTVKKAKCLRIDAFGLCGDSLKKLETQLPYHPAFPLLGIHTKETRIERSV